MYAADLGGNRIPKPDDKPPAAVKGQPANPATSGQEHKAGTSADADQKAEAKANVAESVRSTDLDPEQKFALLTEKFGVRPRTEHPQPRSAFKSDFDWAMRERRLSG
eukprot:g70283.t1